MKTAIVTDSTSYIPEAIRKEHNIHMIPLQVMFGNDSYEEEQELSVEEFYQKAKEEFPKTSQPPIGEFVTLYRELANDYDHVISVHLSSGISGTLQGAMQAGEMVEEIQVHAFDSEISCAMQGFYVLKAAELAKAGMDVDSIMGELSKMKQSMRAYFMVEDLMHLQRGGRLSGAQAVIGGLLQIKPLLIFEEKVIIPFEKIRTRKKAMKRIADLLQEDALSGEPIRATVIHANRPEEARQWLTELEKLCPQVDFEISYFGPVIGAHLGEGAMGLGWVKK
ncbi:DegV family protein [Planococcus salinus]|uniref:DegV family protein n=1 Tax=Planococcus salinus TaxID=1848460 RepID=A0A3M8P3E7_9BACL|nr:DegV family protein [Planococcus salinus]RNF38212.1 DegV family protein [Planococcus salinus]